MTSSNDHDDEFEELFGSAPAEEKPKNSESSTSAPFATIKSEATQQNGSATATEELNESEDEDLDYESDENDDNVVTEEELRRIEAAEALGEDQSKSGTAATSSEDAATKDEEDANDDTTGTKAIKDEKTEQLLSDVKEKYQPLFPGSSEPKINNKVLQEDLEKDYEDHPWRKPQANNEDYFNYGFNESTWNMFRKRQKGMRARAAMSKPITVFTGFVASESSKRYETADDMRAAKDLYKGKGMNYDEDTKEAALNNLPDEVITVQAAKEAPKRERRRENLKVDLADLERDPAQAPLSASSRGGGGGVSERDPTHAHPSPRHGGRLPPPRESRESSRGARAPSPRHSSRLPPPGDDKYRRGPPPAAPSDRHSSRSRAAPSRYSPAPAPPRHHHGDAGAPVPRERHRGEYRSSRDYKSSSGRAPPPPREKYDTRRLDAEYGSRKRERDHHDDHYERNSYRSSKRARHR